MDRDGKKYTRAGRSENRILIGKSGGAKTTMPRLPSSRTWKKINRGYSRERGEMRGNPLHGRGKKEGEKSKSIG